MQHDIALILWQGGIALAVAFAWAMLSGLRAVRRRLGDSAAPVNGMVFILCLAGFISGALGFAADNWPFYALMALGLSMTLLLAVIPLLLWRFPLLTREAGRGLLMPWTVAAASLAAFGLLRVALWLLSGVWSFIAGIISGVINAF